MDQDRQYQRRDRHARKRSRSRSASRGDDDHDDSNRRKSKDKDKDKKKEGHTRHSSKRHNRDKHRSDHRYDSRSDESSSASESASASSNSSRSDRKRRHSKKRHRKDKKKKNHKKKKDRKHSSKKNSHHRSRHSRSRSPSNSLPTAITTAPPGAHELASALTQLFESYPAMTSLDEGGISLLLIQLSRGTEYNLSQMPDRGLARLLGVVFEAMRIHGMEIGANGAWKWGNAPMGGNGRQGAGGDLALLRLTRALLNGVGFTMDSVGKYEQDQMQKLKQIQEQERQQATQHVNKEMQVKEAAIRNAKKTEENEKDVRHKKRVERMTSQMLDRFDPKNSSSSASSLANELQGICDVLMEGESVQLDGIENAKLRATLAQLFKLIGLDMVEMEDEEDEGGEIENDNDQEKAMGYALPDISGVRDTITLNLNEVLRVCRFRSSGGSEGAPTSWAANPAISTEKVQAQEESSSDDDDGPAPLGTVAAVKASKRKRPPQQKSATSGGVDEGGREEWMMVPGEHDFLKGISKSTRSRTFKNEKMRGQSILKAQGPSAGPINPEVLAEVSAIQKAYEQSRGPSLLDAHRQQLHETKQHQQDQKDWTWSRDTNLDDGRRVDKNALHQVLGGASTELKSKFQGSLGGH